MRIVCTRKSPTVAEYYIRAAMHMRKDAIVRDLQTTKNETDINHGASRELFDVVNIAVRIETERVLYA